MDKKDIEILSILQNDATIPLNELAQAVNLSSTPCWRRLQKLQEDGVIKKQVVICDPLRLNLSITVFVAIRTNQHNEEWTRRFISGARDIPEIVEIYRMSGETDYLLKVLVPDIAGCDAVYKKLTKVAELSDVSSSFVMEVVKTTTALPLGHVKY